MYSSYALDFWAKFLGIPAKNHAGSAQVLAHPVSLVGLLLRAPSLNNGGSSFAGFRREARQDNERRGSIVVSFFTSRRELLVGTSSSGGDGRGASSLNRNMSKYPHLKLWQR